LRSGSLSAGLVEVAVNVAPHAILKVAIAVITGSEQEAYRAALGNLTEKGSDPTMIGEGLAPPRLAVVNKSAMRSIAVMGAGQTVQAHSVVGDAVECVGVSVSASAIVGGGPTDLCAPSGAVRTNLALKIALVRTGTEARSSAVRHRRPRAGDERGDRQRGKCICTSHRQRSHGAKIFPNAGLQTLYVHHLRSFSVST
jgi:hypothetical protein